MTYNSENSISKFIGLFVQHPLRIFALGMFYFVSWVIIRWGLSRQRANALLVPAIYCIFFAIWEWFVNTRTPEANIRIDLLLIWPILLLLTVWSVWQVIRS